MTTIMLLTNLIFINRLIDLSIHKEQQLVSKKKSFLDLMKIFCRVDFNSLKQFVIKKKAVPTLRQPWFLIGASVA
jgi:hypothetical protein